MSELFSVSLHKCSYEPEQLGAAVMAMAPILDLDRSFAGTTVLLKPNFITSMGTALACTHAEVLRAVALWFIEHGARVKIGDSPAFGSVQGVMRRYGMAEVLADLPIEMVEFNHKIKKTLADGTLVHLATEALDCDLFVNLPKLKAHDQMYVTGAVKNIFGIVVGMEKAVFHMRRGDSHGQFAEFLLQIANLLPRQISIVDGIEAMHCSGPIRGRKLDLQCLAGAVNPVALDTALLEMLQLPKEKSPLWIEAKRQQHPGTLAENIHYSHSQPVEFHGVRFIPPLGLNSIRFNPLRFLVSGVRRFILAIRA